MAWTELRVAKLALGSYSGFGSRSLRKIWNAFKDPRHAWVASASTLEEIGIMGKSAKHFAEWRKKFDPAALIDLLERESIQVFFRDDPEYPQALQTSNDPPEILFVRGKLVDAPAIAVVGTRHVTSYGKQCVDIIVPDLARTGFPIVSGLALGVDGLVHRATLNANGITIAVLGTGIENASIYPRTHLKLAHEIIARGGAIISEFAPGTNGFQGNFIMRNRLIAALALATVVIEADQGSGSLITAKLALEENHEVLAVPGPIWVDESRGTNGLIKSGAKVCTCSADVLEAIAYDQPELISQARARLPLDLLEEEIIKALTEPKHIDDIALEIETSVGNTSAKLALLEMKGLVKPIGGQMWIRSK